MERETIIYFYMQSASTKVAMAAKEHWWQPVRLPTKVCTEGEEEFRVVACPIPQYYYRKKKWKPEVLCACMKQVENEMEGMTDTFISYTVAKLLPENLKRLWGPRIKTIRMLLADRIAKITMLKGCFPEQMLVYLGSAQDADWQMELTWEIALPYLSRINRCIVWYEEIPGVDMSEELEPFLEDYYYEYGLVVQLEKYGTQDKQNRKSSAELCLDYRKDNLHREVLKYLDTLVKNGYYY